MNSARASAATGCALDKILASNMFRRIASAAVLVPLFYWIVKTGGFPFESLILFAALWSGYEWLAMVNRPEQKAVWIIVLFSHAVTWGMALQQGNAGALLVALSISLISMAGFAICKVRRPVLLSMGISYLGACMVGLIALRQLPHGYSLTAFLCACSWMTDTGAYFFGKFLRGARMAPDISPSKTWAGFVGGILTALATAGVCIWVFAPQKPITVLYIALGLSLASQCGDLFESWVKRQAGVKNSSDLIPGHGGLLDRVDGLIMATLMFWAGLWLADFDLTWWQA